MQIDIGGHHLSVRCSNRVPPKRRKPKYSIWRAKVWPAVKISFVTIVFVMFAWCILNRAWRPVKLYTREYRETQQLAKQVAEMKHENADLERRINYLKTSRGSAEAARKLGWVKPGEVTLVMPDDHSSR